MSERHIGGKETGGSGRKKISKQARDAQIRDKWKWAEPSIWTERMLTALEEGVKGSKWFTLMDKVYSGKNLKAAWEKSQSQQRGGGNRPAEH